MPRKSPVPRLSRRAQERDQRGGAPSISPATLRSLRQRQRVRHAAHMRTPQAAAVGLPGSASKHSCVGDADREHDLPGLTRKAATGGILQFPLLCDAVGGGQQAPIATRSGCRAALDRRCCVGGLGCAGHARAWSEWCEWGRIVLVYAGSAAACSSDAVHARSLVVSERGRRYSAPGVSTRQ